MEALQQSLAGNPQLVLPSSLYQHGEPTRDQAEAHLQGLSPAALLQRYGRLMTPEQLQLFAPLRDSNYEVAHALAQHGVTAAPAGTQQPPPPLQQQQQQQPQAGANGHHPTGSSNGVNGSSAPVVADHGSDGPARGGSMGLSTSVRNRRLAAMQRLQAQGEFFGLDAMRSRAPLLYHDMVGRYMGDEHPQGPGTQPLVPSTAEPAAAPTGPPGMAAASGGATTSNAPLPNGTHTAPAARTAASGAAAAPSGSEAQRIGGHGGGGRGGQSSGTEAAEHGGGAGGVVRGPGGLGGGEAGGVGSLSGLLLAQHDRAMEYLRMERERAVEQEQLSEHDSDEEEEEEEEAGDEDMQGGGHQQHAPNGTGTGAAEEEAPHRRRAVEVSAEDLAQKHREFVQEMELRFIFGHDARHVDYGPIDADADGTLDDHWAAQAGQDAQDKYFDAEEEGQGGGAGEEQSAMAADEYDY